MTRTASLSRCHRLASVDRASCPPASTTFELASASCYRCAYRTGTLVESEHDLINAETASPAARIVLEQLHASEALCSRRVAKSTLRARGAATGGRATHLGDMSSTVVPEVAVRAATPSLNPCRAGLFSPWPWPAPRTTRACPCSCEPARYLQVAGSDTLQRSACARFSWDA